MPLKKGSSKKVRNENIKKESDARDQKVVDKIEHEFRKRMVSQ